eukprot:8286148-Lingulodinium_polyedra.AAC.1
MPDALCRSAGPHPVAARATARVTEPLEVSVLDEDPVGPLGMDLGRRLHRGFLRYDHLRLGRLSDRRGPG